MAELPLTLTIEADSSSPETRCIRCVGLLRDLGVRRKVYEGTCADKAVVAKVFGHRIKSRYHMEREWRGLNMLASLDLAVPRALFCGRAEGVGWVVVTEKIADAQTVREIWDQTEDNGIKRELLCQVSRELARQHTKGVLQKDLHLGNFLVQGEKLFALDPAQMRFLHRPVDRNEAIDQLALLASFACEEDGDAAARVFEHYAQVRSWEFGPSDTALFGKRMAQSRRRGIRNALRKCLRTNKRDERFGHGQYRGVAARDFFENAGFDEVVDHLDELMERGQVLKRGNTCFVSRLDLWGRQVVVKRYNHKGIVHSVRHTLKGSRARRCWVHAHRLCELNIATPRPLAYIEQYKGMVLRQSYLITEYVAGAKLSDFLHNGDVSAAQRSEAAEQIRELLAKMHKYFVTHGDLKGTNILITDNGPVLTDLDAMKSHSLRWTHGVASARDRERVSTEVKSEGIG
jgi:tRNA A-37 threonylcarbamoyl transferase component Bud32